MSELATEEKSTLGRPSARPVRVLLVYPNTSDVALANLGFQRVYGLLNRIDGVICDRFSLPVGWKPETQKLDKEHLRSEDGRRLPGEFDMIAFSISFEPDYLAGFTLPSTSSAITGYG